MQVLCILYATCGTAATLLEVNTSEDNFFKVCVRFRVASDSATESNVHDVEGTMRGHELHVQEFDDVDAVHSFGGDSLRRDRVAVTSLVGVSASMRTVREVEVGSSSRSISIGLSVLSVAVPDSIFSSRVFVLAR